ncbi:MAG: ribose 5-phosphate isomerase B [Clostridiales bacterium]|nr:ribose 5-phosphate isomerase B [Clostridiales bacterium]
MKIAIGNDHAAPEMKFELIKRLEAQGHEVVNFGTDDDKSCDYPDYGEKVARAVASGEFDRGILICGTGVGISISANKVKGIRCCVCSEPCTARLSREHNDANIIAFGARIVGQEMAEMIVDTFLNTEFSGGERHTRRVAKIMALEN